MSCFAMVKVQATCSNCAVLLRATPLQWVAVQVDPLVVGLAVDEDDGLLADLIVSFPSARVVVSCLGWFFLASFLGCFVSSR